MELYSRQISPFAARVRISILAKELPVRIIDDPDVGSDAFGKINPARRVPVLVLGDGTSIPESDTIVEYLEDAHPKTPLRPEDSVGRARVRLLARAAELYLFPAAVPIFAALARRDGEEIERLFLELDRALGTIATLLEHSQASWHAWGDRLTTADGSLTPFLFYVQLLGQAGERKPLAAYPRLERFWEGAQKQPVLAAVIGQIAEAFRARRAEH